MQTMVLYERIGSTLLVVVVQKFVVLVVGLEHLNFFGLVNQDFEQPMFVGIEVDDIGIVEQGFIDFNNGSG